jgi:hypothetical protein
VPTAVIERLVEIQAQWPAAPYVAQTFLVDGVVAGTWRLENGRVVHEPFAPPSRAVRRELEDEAGRLEAFLNGEE